LARGWRKRGSPTSSAPGSGSNRPYISLYAGPIGLEPFVSRLPKANLGRGCIRFKRVADVDLAVIDEVVRASAAKDGQAITY
jgi:predicted oxidoreductase